MPCTDDVISPNRADVTRSPSGSKVGAALGVYAVTTLGASVIFPAMQPLSKITPAVLSLVQFAPTVGALVTWLMFRRTVAGVHPAALSGRRLAGNVAAMVVVCVGYWSLVMAAAVVSGTATVGPAAVGGVPFVVFLVVQLVGAGGEEIGWRGVMQPLLEFRMARFWAVAVTGVVWALWHVQAFTAGPVVAGCFFVATMAFAMVLGYLGTGSLGQRVLVASIGHWLINIAGYLLAGDATTDRPQIVFVAVAAVLVAVATMTVRAMGTRR
ncbi:type II CAAX endopeptidase family protein [Nocardia sp. NPDC050378]|uniref:CPBP family intramembrane glutamic endopeptidase n=1 Tax=Nocardia sp. NPDC050378 TaxID=3155400 RepID=UPI0033F86AC7